MKLSAFALALAAALVWGGAIFAIGALGLLAPGYGDLVLSIAASVYPGYHNSGTFGDLVVGTLYALLDGLVGGYIFAWLYNLLVDFGASKASRASATASAPEAAGP